MANILVTGANRGLGLEFVKQLSAFCKPTTVFALCRDPTKAQDLNNVVESHTNVKLIKADLMDFDTYSGIAAIVQQHLKGGGLHLLVNNAGVLYKDDLETVTVENMVKSNYVNVIAPLMLTKALLPLLEKADQENSLSKQWKSLVLNISSQLGSIGENTKSGYVSYRISKAALNMVTRSILTELECSNIHAVSLHPGWVRTDMGGPSAPMTPEESVRGMLKAVLEAEKPLKGFFFGHNGRKIPW